MDRRENPTILPDDSLGAVSHGRRPIALVICDDPFANLEKLTSKRCKAALPFAGKYRLIDFALSSCVNSEIETVGVVTQYKPRSLHAHIAYGRPWDLDRQRSGLTLLHPYQARAAMNWYTGSADALYQNQDFFLRYKTDQVLILAGSQMCAMDFGPLIAQHHKTGADLTIAAAHIDKKSAPRYPTLEVDANGRVQRVIPQGSGGSSSMALMGVLLFSTETLKWRLEQDQRREQTSHDLVRDVIPHMLQDGDRVLAFQYIGYWNALQTVYDYWQAGMDLLCESPLLNLQDASWPIRTQPEIRPPTRISSGARIAHSLISEGCIVDGTVEYSILSPGVCVAPGAVVRNTVVMHNTSIEERALVENTILDMDITIGPQARVGKSHRRAPTVHPAAPVQLTIVEKGARIPAHAVIEPEPEGQDWLMAQQQPLSSTRIDAL